MKNSRLHIVFALILFLFSHVAQSQLEAWGDTTICDGGHAQLHASSEGVSYLWKSYPTDPSLLIPQQQNPIVSPHVNTMYVVQSNIATGNLILNGSFELGVVGFNSEYVNNQVSIVDEGTYAVVSDAHTVHPNFFCDEDHTSGNGKFMAVNGSGEVNVKVWYLTLNNVQPGRRYEFSTWITSLHETNPAKLQFSINGILMGEPFQAYPYTCDWYQFFYVWESETNEEATISIVNQNTILSGNDFALDDISFATVLVYYDTVYVDVLPQFNSPFTAPGQTCTSEIIQVNYTGNAPDTADFYWDFGSATVLSGSGPGPYEIVHNVIGNNSISLWVDGPGCRSDTTYRSITVGESPVVTATADDAILPYGSSTTLHGTYSGGLGPYNYSWNHPELLIDPASLDPQTIALEYTTSFILSVMDQSAGCTGHDTVLVQVAGGPLGIGITADFEEICPGEQSVITAQGYGGTENYSYSWSSDPPGFNSTLPEITVEPIITTHYIITINDGLSTISETITITVHEESLPYAGIDQTIPYGTNTYLHGSASEGSGNYGYSWEPSDLVRDPYAAVTQTVNLIGTTFFNLTVTDMVTGCAGVPDEMIVYVEGGPLAVVINSETNEICEGDSVTLTAYPSGGNQGNYSYSWSDNHGNSYPSTPQITVAPMDTTIYNVIVDDGFNSIGGSKEIIVNPSTEFDWPGGATVIYACPYDQVTLEPYPKLPGWSYLWSNGSVEDHITIGVTGIGFSMDTYTLTTTSEDGCSFSRSVLVIFDFSYCAGIHENETESELRIIPNPGLGRFRIEWDEITSFDQITIVNSAGGEILSSDIRGLSSIETNLKNYPSGVYIVHLRGHSKMVSGRLVILPE